MRKLALGIAAAAVMTVAAVPAMAQVGFYAGPGGVGVQFGAPGYYDYYGPAPYDGYYDYYNGPSVGFDVRPGWHGHVVHHERRR